MIDVGRGARGAKLVFASLLIGVLSACAGQSVRPSTGGVIVPAADAAEREAARSERVRAIGDWSFTGRIAVSNAGKGGSGRIEWSQRGERYDVALSAPVTRQSWRLSGGADGARLEGLEGGPREGADADQLLLETTGWEIPVAALGDWLRGLPAADMAAAKTAPGADGRPLSIEQGGWSIAYQWPASGDLPSRLDAKRGQARVRLIVDEWQAVAKQATANPQGNGWITPVAALRPNSPPVSWEPLRSDEDALRLELLGLNLEDPVADLHANVERGDLRAVAIAGDWGARAPGLEDDPHLAQQTRVLNGTQRGVVHDARLLDNAERYARAYNLALRDWLAAHASVEAAAASDPGAIGRR